MPFPSYSVVEYPTGGVEPWGICFDGTRVWSCDYNNVTPGVWVFLASNGSLVTFIPLAGANDCCFDGTNVWVTWNDGTNEYVAKYVAATQTLVNSYALSAGIGGTTLGGLVFDGTNIWICQPNFATVIVLLAATGATVATYSTGVGTNPQSIAFDGTYMWTANSNTNDVSKLLASTGALSGPYSTGAFSEPTCITFGAGNIFVSSQGTNPTFIPSVFKIDPASGSVIATYPTGTSSGDTLDGIAFDGTYIWVLDSSSNQAIAMDPATGTVLGTFNTYPSGGPFLLAIATPGPNIWVSNNNVAYLTELVATIAPTGPGPIISDKNLPVFSLPFCVQKERECQHYQLI